ncbi:glycosyltransferase family 4 protein [Microbulbifer yueqingensis]|uniref:Glycosyltransferase involved in cell wall bisynthesis n=1 Tax=Microbulbifer yueqingensis TaxID=658219 RepID=A0A1G8VLP2_9GAMM|nr:glycosyltransferase family 4 protein [Microbulbifer yueqingensis]SDJ66889.1 Glycosyltransferase involved in cell wall bisynthesis [Microbulbifer yueqingensis]
MRTPAKIVLLSTFYERLGGISTYVKAIEREMVVGFRSKVKVISPDKEDKLVKWPSSRLGKTYRALRELVRERPDSVHCHCAWYLQLAAILYARVFSFKKVSVFAYKHSDIPLGNNELRNLIFLALDMSASQVLFISQYLKNKYCRELSRRYSNAEVLMTGVTVSENPSAELALRLPERYISYVGVMEYAEKVRGLELLIQAYAKLAENPAVDVDLVVVGGGALSERVVKLISEKGLVGRIHLFSGLQDPTTIYRNSLIHCHITYQDTMPMVILEALESGTNVIASKFGGIPEINAEGLYVVENDADQIAYQIKLVLQDGGQATKVGAEHSWSEITKRILTLTA